MKKFILCFMALFMLLGLGVGQVKAEDDLQYWSRAYFKIHDGEKLDFNLYVEGRLRDDAERLEVYLFSPKWSYALNENVNLGFNYTYLLSRGATRDDFGYQHRAEVEVNPYWKFDNGLKLATRNRMEFRWIEGSGHDNPRLRNRVRLSIPVEDMGALTSIFADTESFYDFDADEYKEQRTIPFGANFKVNDSTNFQAFWMIQATKGSDSWKSSQILGTMLTYKF